MVLYVVRMEPLLFCPHNHCIAISVGANFQHSLAMEKFLVSASTGAMSSLLGKLGTMLRNEYKLLKNVRGDIEFLKDELEAIRAFLLMMADVEEPDKQAKLRADAVRDLSYDIEDKIDKFMLLEDHEYSSDSDSFRELFCKSMKKIADVKTRHKIAKEDRKSVV